MENEIMKDIEQYFNCQILKDTYHAYNNLWREKPQFPYFNYWGINFDTKGVVSVKFYFHIFNKINESDAKKFLPTTDDFTKYYPLYEESLEQNIKHSGCAFTLKFYPKKPNAVRGFQFRVKQSDVAHDLIGQSIDLPFLINENNLPSGINYEYHEDKPLRKIYHYFNQEEHKKYFAQRFQLPFLEAAELIEYSESERFSKINTWYKNNRLLHHQANIFPEAQKKVVQQLCSKYNLTAKVFGYYETADIKAIYLFSNELQKNASDTATNTTYTDTIKSLIETTREQLHKV